jgi:diguanylate cyclase (GGDEF)-like protein
MSQVVPFQVLLIDDNLGHAIFFKELLTSPAQSPSSFLINHVTSVHAGLDLCNVDHFDIVLVNLNIETSDILDAIKIFQDTVPQLPLIVFSEDQDEELALQAVKAGAQDYFFLNEINEQIFLREIRYAIERKQQEEKLFYLAQYDVVTGLPNRVLFRDRLDRALTHAERNNTNVVLMFLDLDHFKAINDSLGHDAGDQLLKQVGQRLVSCLRKEDTIARLGGDEFTIVLNDIERPDKAAKLAQKIIDVMSRSFSLEGLEIFVTTSIGIAAYPNCGSDASTLIKNADAALYSAKESGRSTFRFYHEKMNRVAGEKLSMVTDLRHAVERNEFVLHYQPQVDCNTGAVVGVEALIRWMHPERGLIYPGEFISLLEETGLVIQVGEWVLRTACEQCKTWQSAGLPPLRVAVNISARQFWQKNLVKIVSQVLQETQLDPTSLELELTESLLIENVSETVAILRALHGLGVQLSVDDFGTGYSSLVYLKQFPLHALKIDRSFLQDIHVRPENAAITEAIINLAHSLQLGVVAEGIENETQYNFIRKHGCDMYQGFLLAKPMTADDFEQWMSDKRSKPAESFKYHPLVLYK